MSYSPARRLPDRSFTAADGRRGAATKTKPVLAAKYGGVPGLWGLVAKAFRGKGSYQWQMSTDQKAWTDLPPTTKAKTSVAGLIPATVAYFRFRTLTKTGVSDWSTVVSIVAH